MAYSILSSVLPPSLRHKRAILERVGRNFGFLRKSPVAKAMTLELHLGHPELQIPPRLPGQPLFLPPSRDQPRKRGCIWPAACSTLYQPTLALLPCYHLHVKQVLSTCPVRTLSPATVWGWGQLCLRALWVHCKCCFLMKWNLLHCLWASPMQNVHSSTMKKLRRREVIWLTQVIQLGSRETELNSGLWMPGHCSVHWALASCESTTNSGTLFIPYFWVAPIRKLRKTRFAFHLLGHFWAGAHIIWRWLPKLLWNRERHEV